MALVLTEAQNRAIREHGEETFPNECCGFILGTVDGTQRTVSELLRADNEREDDAQFHRFLITPEAYMRSEKTARGRGLDIIGFYHSHPDAPARPSQYDLDHAWPFYSYVIVSVRNRVADTMTSWILKEDRSAFEEQELTVQNGKQ